MKGISFNGHKLHEVEMLLEPYHVGTTSSLRYPKHRIEFKTSDTGMKIRMPGYLALELYRRGILSPNPEDPISIEISGKKQGDFKIVDFRYPNTSSRNWETVSITLERFRRLKGRIG